MDVQAVWLCMAPAAPRDPAAHPAAALEHPTPPLLPSPCPPSPFHGKSERRKREIVPAVLGRRRGEGEDGGTIPPPPPGSSQPLPMGRRLNWRSQLCPCSSSQWFCWQVSAGWLSLATASKALRWCARDTGFCRILLLVHAHLFLAVISSHL